MCVWSLGRFFGEIFGTIRNRFWYDLGVGFGAVLRVVLGASFEVGFVGKFGG